LWGASSTNYSASTNVGLAPTWTLNTTGPGTTYYSTARASNRWGLGSSNAPEVSETSPGGTPLPPGPPFGVIETPANGTSGVTGSIPVTGWALDNTGVARVAIYRSSVAGEAPGTLVFLGDAAFVPGARPDVAAQYPSAPN